jgi:hypothetical protein
VTAEGLDASPGDDRPRACRRDLRLRDHRARLAARNEGAVGAYAAIGEGLAQIGVARALRFAFERAVREADNRDLPERRADGGDACPCDIGVRVGRVIERAVRLHRAHAGDRPQRRALLCDLAFEDSGRDIHGFSAKSRPIHVRRMRADARTDASTRLGDPCHRSHIPRMTAAGDVNRIRERVELYRLVFVLTAIEIQQHVATIPHRP